MNILKSGLVAVALATSVTAGAAAQQHRHTPRTATVSYSQSAGGQRQQVTVTTDTAGVDAFSDTTSVVTAATADTLPGRAAYNAYFDFDSDNLPFGLSRMFKGAEAFFWVVFAIFVLAIFAPVIAVVVLLILLYRSRQRKLQEDRMVRKNGQPLHEQPANRPAGDDSLWATGVQQGCLGVGLMAFFAFIGINLGIGIGALLVCVGAGKMIVAKSAEEKRKRNGENA